MGWDRKDREQHPLTRRQRWVNTAASVAAGFTVMAATENVLWGLLTFMGAWVVISVAMLARQKR
ncbi:MAG: hypothetical protein V3V35_02325 [Dehalococcoidia bacterium]